MHDTSAETRNGKCARKWEESLDEPKVTSLGESIWPFNECRFFLVVSASSLLYRKSGTMGTDRELKHSEYPKSRLSVFSIRDRERSLRSLFENLLGLDQRLTIVSIVPWNSKNCSNEMISTLRSMLVLFKVCFQSHVLTRYSDWNHCQSVGN